MMASTFAAIEVLKANIFCSSWFSSNNLILSLSVNWGRENKLSISDGVKIRNRFVLEIGSNGNNSGMLILQALVFLYNVIFAVLVLLHFLQIVLLLRYIP